MSKLVVDNHTATVLSYIQLVKTEVKRIITVRKSKAALAAEQSAERERLEREYVALRWTDSSDIAPDVPPPDGWGELTTGWTFNAFGRRVEVACSSGGLHAVGRTDKTTTQRALALFSTRERALRALRALRVALEHEFATELAKIDALLSSES